METKIHPIVKLINVALQEKKMTDYEAGKQAGINRSTVGRILAGESSPTLDKLEALAKVAGVEIKATKTK
ncbi:helix-turn-helix domain-containing protein [Epilithonimonas arachidiradicis]|uniref:Helix-turn-helix protein n=1 Tax=Epilithonimonas arachidiradicis TaxID=1617282 RepID=A0A420DDM8_9FLAO|nr:helix-turn-helix transcriptional regulator [Epilithonimonas arachidiradicis]RKE90025.1 helix-turn-helix protein [Epilithonimonas arachidiradicis]GGG47182.1 hypothetical protein GCM10007332_05850 [Epilithonimonas arachidiradicis]